MIAPVRPPEPSFPSAQIAVGDAASLALHDRADGCTLALGPQIALQLSRPVEDRLRHLLNVREGRRMASLRGFG